jgi:hypothetical protein
LAVFALTALDLFCERVRELASTDGKGSRLVDRLANLAITLLRAHDASHCLRIGTGVPPATGSKILRIVGRAPMHLLALAARLKEADGLGCEALHPSRLATEIGDVVRWTDDLLDSAEDLADGVWNSVWIEFTARGARLLTVSGMPRPHQELLEELCASGVGEAVIRRIMDRLTRQPSAVAAELAPWLGWWGG